VYTVLYSFSMVAAGTPETIVGDGTIDYHSSHAHGERLNEAS